MPALDALREYAEKKKISYKSMADLVANREINRMIQERIEKLEKGFANYEKIKRFTLASQGIHNGRRRAYQHA